MKVPVMPTRSMAPGRLTLAALAIALLSSAGCQSGETGGSGDGAGGASSKTGGATGKTGGASGKTGGSGATASGGSGGTGSGGATGPSSGGGGSTTPAGGGGMTGGSGGAGGGGAGTGGAGTPGTGGAGEPVGAGGGPGAGPDANADSGTPPAPPSSTSGLEQRLVTRALGLAYYHLCLVLPNRGLRCSGDVANAGDPRIHPPAGLKPEQIVGAHNGFCVLREGAALDLPDGFLGVSVNAKRLTCWGHKNTFFPPAGLDMDPIQYGIGYDHGCALNRDGSVVCWGQGGTNFKAPDGLRAKALTVAAFFNCAIQMDDTVTCWGINPPMPPPGLKVKLLAATFHGNDKLPDAPKGTNHACAIKLDDTVTCWGTEVEGNLTPPADLTAAKDIAVSTWDSCALRPNGEPVCWGKKVYDNFDAVRYHKMPAGLRLKGIRASMATYCGIKMEDDTVVCWGDEQHEHITFPAGGVKVYSPN